MPNADSTTMPTIKARASVGDPIVRLENWLRVKFDRTTWYYHKARKTVCQMRGVPYHPHPDRYTIGPQPAPFE